MSADRERFLNLNVYLRNPGYHESAWKVQDADPAAVLEIRSLIELAQIAERGIIDSIFLPDSPGTAEFRCEYLPGMWFDPMQLLSAVATGTEQIGLIATVSTTYSYPWDVARRLATLDFISHGRAGWNIVTTAEPAAAGNFGRTSPPAGRGPVRARRGVRGRRPEDLGWLGGRRVRRRRGRRHVGRPGQAASAAPSRHALRRPRLSAFPRSPQGHPLLTQAGSSPPGIALAAKYADAVFTPLSDIPAGVQYRERLRDQAAANGRDPDHVRVLPGLSFLLADTEAGARAKHDELEAAASSEFRWRNTANLAGLDYTTIDPDAPLPPELLDDAPKTSFGAVIYRLAQAEPMTFREVAMKVSSLPGGLDYTGTPEGMADLIAEWFEAGACDGFTLMPNILPSELQLFVDQVVPLLQARGIARREYRGTTLRDHLGLPRPSLP